MLNFKKIFLIIILGILFSFSFQASQKVYAANIFGFTDPPGCESKDLFLPNLVICGRNPASTEGCSAYTQQCSLGDLVNTGGRMIVWLISMILLIVPLIIMYYGAQVIWYRQFPESEAFKKIKSNLYNIIIYFILMLSAWLIVRTVVDVFQVDTSEGRINTFLIDENGAPVKARTFNTN